MLNRRQVLSAGVAAGTVALVPQRRASAAATRIDVYTNSDANVSDWWTNVVKPAFEAAHPELEINIVISRGAGSGGIVAIADRAFAALKAGADPQVDFFEQHDPRLPKEGIEAGLWVRLDAGTVPGYGRVNPLAIETPYGLPYRGSQVVLAYDSEKVAEAEVPKDWAGLVAWIKAHPGQFIYGRPDKGGSGRNFVVRAIHEANGRDPALFTVANHSKQAAEERLPKAWAILNDLAPSLYEKGAYAAGNTPTLQLLASGAVSMIPAWSDQALQGIAQGVLPPSVKLFQLQDLALCGSFADATVPSNAAHKDAALALADFLLTDEIQVSVVKDLGGFPGVDWGKLPPELKDQFAAVIPTSIPTYPGGDWEAAMNDGWYRNVAPNIDRSK
ncbi:extracellular solute-binding protein [Inquilinus sp. Marseille-Q2685]|uniref:extracellular solute-binding protein n=1 Tax=Inquilinus sp. Marseille-Q2685 TaxID=2866581 RepID=UPI001CE3E014|nr:extracellular solute-binding protein [Inquilinus sp. Marseille-Q2685]